MFKPYSRYIKPIILFGSGVFVLFFFNPNEDNYSNQILKRNSIISIGKLASIFIFILLLKSTTSCSLLDSNSPKYVTLERKIKIDTNAQSTIDRLIKRNYIKTFEEYGIGTGESAIEGFIASGVTKKIFDENFKSVIDDVRDDSGVTTEAKLHELRKKFAQADFENNWEKRRKIATQIAVFKTLKQIPDSPLFVLNGYNLSI